MAINQLISHAPIGDLTSVTDENVLTTNYQYDCHYDSIAAIDPMGHKTSSTYDAFGTRLTLTDPDLNTTTWVYDQYDRVVSETAQGGSPKTYQYDDIGQVIWVTKPDGTRIHYIYDPVAHTKTEEWYTGTSVAQTLSYAYDAFGNLVDANQGTATVHRDYSNGEVTKETQTLAAGIGASFGYTYDDSELRSIRTTATPSDMLC